MGGSTNAVARPNVVFSEARMKLWTILGAGFLGARLLAQDDLSPPPVGSYQLRILAPSLLELTLVTTKPPDPAPVAQWNFGNARELDRLPKTGEFAVSANGRSVQVRRVGFKRRVLYAPFRKRDLRIGNYLYLELSEAIGENPIVVVRNPSHE